MHWHARHAAAGLSAKPKSRATCMLEDDLGLQDTRTKILQDFSAHKNVNRNTPNIVISTHPWLCPCGGNRERWRQLPYLHVRTSAMISCMSVLRMLLFTGGEVRTCHIVGYTPVKAINTASPYDPIYDFPPKLKIQCFPAEL